MTYVHPFPCTNNQDQQYSLTLKPTSEASQCDFGGERSWSHPPCFFKSAASIYLVPVIEYASLFSQTFPEPSRLEPNHPGCSKILRLDYLKKNLNAIID